MQRASAMLLVLVVCALGWRGVFQFDDFNVIVDYAPVHTWQAFWADLPRGLRPLLKASYTLNWTSGGVLGFHVFNTGVHLVSTGLVYRLAQRMLAWPGSPPVPDKHSSACVVALLFALHPAQTEAITYISGRSASLMAMFYLAGVLAYDQARTMADRPHATSWPWHSLALGCFVAAVASKETALTWPLALLLWDAAAGRKTLQHLPWRKLAWYAAVLVLLCGVLATHTRYQRLLAYSAQLRTLDANLYTQVAGLGHLLLQWCLPWRSNIDPDLPVVDGGALANVGVLACVAAALWSARRLRRHPTLAFAILWWLLQLLPIYVLLPRVDVVNDRQLYLAAWPGLVPLVLHAQHLLERPRLRMAVAALSVAALAWLSVQRNLDYRSEVALWQSTVRLSPHKARPFNNLGYALFQTGDYAGAEAAYLRALALEPDYWLAQRNLDLLETRTGHTEE